MRFRHVAPAGAPIGLIDLARAARLCLTGRDLSDRVGRRFRERFAVRHAFLTSTGRAGMTVLLQALSQLAPGRREVIVPSYTCFSVAASIVKAGLRPRIVDIDPATLDYCHDELSAADMRATLAIVATNLYGLPNDLPGLRRLARDRGVFLIDDAAQAMGASIAGRPCGTWGDVGLFSLDKGKNVSAIDGGVIVTDDDRIASQLESAAVGLVAPSAGTAIVDTLKAVAYAAFLRPRLYWIPNRLPQLGLGQTRFDTDFPLQRPSRPLSALAATVLPALDTFTRVRVDNATALLAGLRSAPGVSAIGPVPGAVPVYLRLPILIENAQARQRALRGLHDAGVGATGSYPASLADVPALRPYLSDAKARATGGRMVAQQLVTLPTHGFVTAADRARTVDIVSDAVSGLTASAYSIAKAG